MLFTKVKIPRWMRKGIRKNERGAPEKKIIVGFDSETVHGKPLTLQFHGPTPETTAVIWTDERRVWADFLSWANKLPGHQSSYILYAVNLEFDLVTLVYPIREKFLTERFEFTDGGWHITGIFSASHFLVMRRAKKTLYLVDISAFLPGSAKKLAERFCPDLPKLPAPTGLGSTRYTPRHRQFVRYAKRDAEICHRIGLYIEMKHAQYDIRQCISGAQMSARIFRHRDLRADIPLPPRQVMYGALHSYHGGRNGLYADPGWYPRVRVIDISSAYPHAMHDFPSFSRLDLYKSVRWTGPIMPDRVPDLGIYNVSGVVSACKWPVLYDHAFRLLRAGPVRATWITGYELNEALRSGELTTTEGHGYYYDSAGDTVESPFRSYVDRFYELKETAPSPTDRHFYKICLLNSLYGKFIQTNGKKIGDYIYDLESGMLMQDLTVEAGGLFNPFIASLITGRTRARMHSLEHQYKAMHTATDGLITQDPSPIPARKSLGSLGVEATGNLLLLRNKLYILYDNAGNVVKKATHGFHGTIQQLEQMLRTGERKYEYRRMVKLKESMRSHWEVNDWKTFSGVLRIPDPTWGKLVQAYRRKEEGR